LAGRGERHINKAIQTNLEQGAVPIAGIGTDIDADPRNTNLPDIGADEFDGERITDVSDENETFPTEYSLYQNYPNPFNPSTKIKYSVPQTSQVQIKVFDVLGNEIATIVKEEKPIGNYEVEFDARELSSGIYFYQLNAGNFVETKKMLLIK
jgi:hypothetical protein